MVLKSASISLTLTQDDWVKLAMHKDEPLNEKSKLYLGRIFKGIPGFHWLAIDISCSELRVKFDSQWEGFEKSMKAVEGLMSEYHIVPEEQYFTT